MLTEIGHMVLGTRDLAACRKLYGSTLGLEELAYGRSDDGREVCMFGIGPSVLELEEDANAPVRAGDPPPYSRIGHFAFLTDSAAQVSAKFKESNLEHGEPSVQPIEHSYLQRSLVQFRDPGDFMIQIAEVVDMRTKSRRAIRRAIKQARISRNESHVLFHAIDHMNMICTDAGATQEFYAQKLGLQEILHRVVDDAEERDFVIGCTELEMWTKPAQDALRPGLVRSLGFWTDDVEHTFKVLVDRDVVPEGPPADWTPFPHIRRRAFTFRDPDGFLLQVAERL